MTSANNRPEARLGRRLQELDASKNTESDELMDRMFADIKARCDKSDRTVAGFFRSRSTTARRLIVLTVFAALAIIGWYVFPLVSEQGRTAQWVASLVSFCVLLILAMLMVTRPVHLPALPRWPVVSLVAVALLATIVSAFWPQPTAEAATHAHDGGILAGMCMGAGLLLGLPVYALLRLVDRGSALGSLVAAAAAGVAANFVLKAHCPIPGTFHELLGHASVAIVFVLGLGLVHRWIPS
jgi:hypothetical protein